MSINKSLLLVGKIEDVERGNGPRLDYPGTMASRRPIRVLLVENDSSVADAIATDFSRSALNVTVAPTLADAKVSLRHCAKPFDVVILELRLPDGRGESLLPDIEACSRQPAVIIYSAFLHELQVHALEYRPLTVAKPVTTATLLQMVKTVAAGYARPMIQRFAARFDLTRRETEATILVVRGLKAKEIADQMCCGEKTVYAHLSHVCEKTGCRDYHEVVAKVVAFACQAIGHTPPDHKAYVDYVQPQTAASQVARQTATHPFPQTAKFEEQSRRTVAKNLFR